MRARARAVLAASARGPTATTLRSESPVLLRWASPTLHVLGGAAGPLGGDDLGLAVEVGPGATVAVRTVAASVVLAAPPGRPSHLDVDVTVAERARLDWCAEPLVSTARSDHLATATVRLAPTAALRWRDDLVLGRHDEAPGRLTTRLRVERDGRPLLHHELTLGPDVAGWAGPAVLGHHRVVLTEVRVEPAWEGAGPPPTTDRTGPGAVGAVLALDGPGVLTVVLGATTVAAGRLMAELTAGLTAGIGRAAGDGEGPTRIEVGGPGVR